MNTRDLDSELNPDDATDDDLAVSSCLDGVATPEQRSRVEADPSLVARLELLRSVSTHVASEVTPPSTEICTTLIATALASLDDDLDTETPSSNVEPLNQPRAHRARTRRLLVAAAVVIALSVPALVTLAQRSGDNQSSDLAASTPSTRVAEGDSPNAANKSEVPVASNERSSADGDGSEYDQGLVSTTLSAGAQGATTEATDGASEPGLGVVNSPDELKARVVETLSADTSDSAAASTPGDSPVTTTTFASSAQGDGDNCEATARASVSEMNHIVMTTTATYMGSYVHIYVFRDSSGTVIAITTPTPGSACQMTATLSL